MAILFLTKKLQFLASYCIGGLYYIGKTPQIPSHASQWHSTQSHAAEACRAHCCAAHLPLKRYFTGQVDLRPSNLPLSTGPGIKSFTFKGTCSCRTPASHRQN